MSDIVCTGEYNKVEPSELNNHKEAIFKCLMITAYGWDRLEAWKNIKKLFAEEKLVLHAYKVSSGFQYRLFGYKEDLRKIHNSSFYASADPWQEKGVKELTNKIVAISIYYVTLGDMENCQYIGDDTLTADAVFPA